MMMQIYADHFKNYPMWFKSFFTSNSIMLTWQIQNQNTFMSQGTSVLNIKK